jgi:hypothetical protein
MDIGTTLEHWAKVLHLISIVTRPVGKTWYITQRWPGLVCCLVKGLSQRNLTSDINLTSKGLSFMHYGSWLSHHFGDKIPCSKRKCSVHRDLIAVGLGELVLVPCSVSNGDYFAQRHSSSWSLLGSDSRWEGGLCEFLYPKFILTFLADFSFGLQSIYY